MAKMLERTNISCARKYRVAFYVRVLLFFGIPMFYFLVNSQFTTIEANNSGQEPSFPSRHLLGLIEQGSENCTPPAILEFPSDGLNRFQRQHGLILVHCVLAVYCFLLLGIVCEDYFVPSIEILCERLNMEADIAGATFMAAASSSPELFINCIGTFVTEGDLGVGAIVGSAVFNVLAVPACCALVAGKVVELDWWSVSRDCMMYAVAVVVLIFTLLDDKVYWYEALLLVALYTFYILNVSSIWSWPGEKSSGLQKLFWLLTWPMGLALWVTIPDCKKRPRFYLLTFTMCVLWIGSMSYLVAWIITVIGDTLNIPDSITGLTILAAGASLPEAVSSILVTKQGHGSMGISNTIGSNTFDILLCLGLPWLIKSVFFPSYPDNHWVMINSSGLSYSAISLLSTLLAFYLFLLLNKFQLDWKIGMAYALVYAGFLIMAAMIELNILFPVNLPICPHS
nr:sodium/potassium/calcium exchanger 4-like [Maniola hyperantus]